MNPFHTEDFENLVVRKIARWQIEKASIRIGNTTRRKKKNNHTSCTEINECSSNVASIHVMNRHASIREDEGN